MGTVYLAYDPQLNRYVAVKLIQGELDSADARERFVREARSIAALNHPNIVTVYDSGEFESRPYFVLERIEGRTLATLIQEKAPVSLALRLRWLEELCDGLQFAHDRGIIHRDVKPANLMIDHLDRLRILDFGIARLAGAHATQASMLIGTPAYMAPEYIRGDDIDHRIDIFAAGAVAYELLTFRPAFPGSTHATIMRNVMESEPAPLTEVAEVAVLPDLEAAILRALAKDPGLRFSRAGDLKDALHAVRERVERSEPTGVATTAGAVAGESVPSMVIDAAVPTVPRFDPALLDSARIGTAPDTRSNIAAEPATAPTWRRYAAIAAAVILVVAVGILASRLLGTPSQPIERVAAVPTPPVTVPPVSDAPATAAPVQPTPAAVAAVDTAVVNHGVSPHDNVATPPSVPAPTPTPAAVATPAPARTLYFSTAAPGATGHLGLRYRVLQRACPADSAETCADERDVDPASTEFQSGDSIRLVFESNTDGYLYVVQEGTSGRWNVLFPDVRINGGRNRIEKRKEYKVPSDDWFTFQERGGTERLFIFLSTEPLAQLPGFHGPVTQVETLARADIDQLEATVRTRDLVFERVHAPLSSSSRNPSPTDGNYVVNVNELGTAVTARLDLTHK
jgi:serine/threonine-protein kinase